ncbi:MAG TPA: hypothetical protein VF748_15105 [Candidatus Acidoferrum sp.]
MKITVALTVEPGTPYRPWKTFELADSSEWHTAFTLGLDLRFVRVYDPVAKRNYWFNQDYIVSIESNGDPTG